MRSWLRSAGSYHQTSACIGAGFVRIGFHAPARDEAGTDAKGDYRTLSSLVSALTSAQVTAEFFIRGGLPADSILDAALTQPADLIVMGTHGRRGLSHALIGSVAESVLRKARCPVLTVRSPKFHVSHRRVTSVASEPIPTNP
ncbi:MAG: universal stress protein [Nitrospira sp.]|nr:universal stress protein [Nitrospira sp.]